MNETLQIIKQEALEENIPIIMDDTLDVIKKEFEILKPTNILEIGTAVGYSAICFSEFAQNIDTIEKDEQRAKKAIENVNKMNLQNKINVICGDAVEILPTINKKYDAVFIDASKGKYPFFLEQSLRLTRSGSIIFADNVLYKGYVLGDYNKHKQRTAVTHLREYLKLIDENPNLETKILEVGDGLAISKVK